MRVLRLARVPHLGGGGGGQPLKLVRGNVAISPRPPKPHPPAVFATFGGYSVPRSYECGPTNRGRHPEKLLKMPALIAFHSFGRTLVRQKCWPTESPPPLSGMGLRCPGGRGLKPLWRGGKGGAAPRQMTDDRHPTGAALEKEEGGGGAPLGP